MQSVVLLPSVERHDITVLTAFLFLAFFTLETGMWSTNPLFLTVRAVLGVDADGMHKVHCIVGLQWCQIIENRSSLHTH